MRDIAIFGAGGHGQTIADLILRMRIFRVVAFVEIDSFLRSDQKSKEIFGIPVISSEEFRMREITNGAIGVGQVTESLGRENIFDQCAKWGIALPPLVASSSMVSASAHVSEASQVMNNAFVGPNVAVGKASIVNNYAQIEHGSTIGDFTHISTGAIVNGDVRIGSRVFVGSGSVVREGVTISDGTFLPMGSLVKRSL